MVPGNTMVFLYSKLLQPDLTELFIAGFADGKSIFDLAQQIILLACLCAFRSPQQLGW